MDLATSAGHSGRVNEDFVAVSPSVVVVVDGAGIPGAEALCRHGVAWYATRLGAAVLGGATLSPGAGLVPVLGEAIAQVTDGHRETCAVSDPISPSAAVAVLRCAGEAVDYLVLGDATIALERAGRPPLVVTDRREVEISRPYEAALRGVPPGSDEHRRVVGELRARRNRVGGFWAAKDDPEAAREAVTGSLAVGDLTAAVVLSNGASRVVDRFGLVDWAGLLELVAGGGAGELIRRVRSAEAEAERSAAPDDATVACCTDFVRGH